MFWAWWRKLRQRIYCANHIGACDHCREWKRAKAERRWRE